MEKIVRQLFRFRWNVPILAELYASAGAKFITLVVKLGISRSVLNSTLKQLIGLGLVTPNPGYGHPLRPEYILTAAGRGAAPFCLELVDTVLGRGEEQLLQSRWAVPVLIAIGMVGVRFSELKARLSPITPRAVSKELKKLIDQDYIYRRIINEFPPVSIYRLTAKARLYVEIYNKHRGQLKSLSDSG